MGLELLAVSMIIAGMGGLIRGLTGFGGALVMMPPLALIMGPRLAVFTVLLLECFAGWPMLREAVRLAHYRVIVPIAVAACVTMPLGAYLLVTADPLVLRRWIAGIVIVFSMVMLTGVRYQGSQRLGTSIALGAFSGVLLGATGIGAPPVILYLLSGPDPAARTRANLTLYVATLSLVMLAVLLFGRIVQTREVLTALILGPCFYIGVKFGARLFLRFSELRFRQFALVLVSVVSALILFL